MIEFILENTTGNPIEVSAGENRDKWGRITSESWTPINGFIEPTKDIVITPQNEEVKTSAKLTTTFDELSYDSLIRFKGTQYRIIKITPYCDLDGDLIYNEVMLAWM